MMNSKVFEIFNNLKQDLTRDRQDHIVLVDGMNTFIRNFSVVHSINADGFHVGGLIGFLQSLGVITRVLNPTRMIVIWEGRNSTAAKKNLNPDYKANRKDTRITSWEGFESVQEESEAIYSQINRLHDYLECLPVDSVKIDTYEADELISYLAKLYTVESRKITIVSSDKDFLQLVSKNIEVYNPVQKKLYDISNIEEKLTVLPENYNIVKAITRDDSDNLVGIKGIGVKTLRKLFPELTKTRVTLDEIFELCEKRGKESKSTAYHKINVGRNIVETNFKIMDLHKVDLLESEKDYLLKLLEEPTPPIHTGRFLSLLNQDKIDSITKNTIGWMDNFRSLTLHLKKR